MPSFGEAQITGVTHQSGDVLPGDLFIAIPGFNSHGIDHFAQACQRGAVAVATDEVSLPAVGDFPSLTLQNQRHDMARISAEVYGHPERKIRLVGVTGTNGKTTVTHMIRSIALDAGLSVGMIGTLGSYLNTILIPSQRTTPEAPDLYALLAYMAEQGAELAVMEVSSHALELARVDGLVFAVSIFTNLSQDHLDFHGTMQNYFAAKSKLFEPSRSQHAIIGIDDEWGQTLANAIQIPIQSVSLTGQNATVKIDQIRREIAGMSFHVQADNTSGVSILESATHHVPLIGAFNVMNATQAVLAAVQIGISESSAWESLSHIQSVTGRMELVPVHERISVVVDYAHTPDAVEKVLAHLRPESPAKLITVIGCGGDRDASKRPLMGHIAEQHSDVVIVTDDNPRSENPEAIRNQVCTGIRNITPLNIGDRRQAIFTALSMASEGDTIAVLGKGHEQGQEIMGVTYPFCDQDVIREEAIRVFT